MPNNIDRKYVVENLRKIGIPSMVYYKIPIHLQEGYSRFGYNEGDFFVSESSL